MIRYKYRKNKENSIHIVNDYTGKTFCKLENSKFGGKLDTISETYPEKRSVCNVCIQLSGPLKDSPENRRKLNDFDFYTSWEWAKLRLLQSWQE